LGYPDTTAIQNAEQLHNEKQNLMRSKKIRIISGVAVDVNKLSIQEQIILTLVYLGKAHDHVSAAWHQFKVKLNRRPNDTFNYWFATFRRVGTIGFT